MGQGEVRHLLREGVAQGAFAAECQVRLGVGLRDAGERVDEVLETLLGREATQRPDVKAWCASRSRPPVDAVGDHVGHQPSWRPPLRIHGSSRRA